MKGMIVYYSKTGFTRRYARWIGQETGWKAVPLGEAAEIKLSEEDVFVFGSGLHAGSLVNLPRARKLFRGSGAGKFMVFATGAMPCTERETIAHMWRQNLTEEELVRVPHFYLQGGLNYERMGLADRILMRGLRFFLNRKKNPTEKDREFAKAIARSYDISSREYLKPLLEAIPYKAEGEGD